MHDEARPAARLTVLTGPSGVGRNGVVELVRARSPLLWVSLPATTRPRREHEVDGVHHSFVERAEFERMIADGGLLEWAEIAGHLYGTPGNPVRSRLAAGRPVLVRADPAGARRIRDAVPGARLVYLVAPGAPDDPGAAAGADATIVNDRAERAAGELVGLLGSSFLTPAQPRLSG
jgi:guanylate kinase